MFDDWIGDFKESLDAWDGKYIITSPDVDGILSACLMGNEFGAKLAGVYTTRYLILFDDITSIDVRNALWLDHDVSEDGIQCMGQHLIDHSEMDKLPKRGANSFNPNNYFRQTWKSSFHGSKMRMGKRDKYPYATIHFLMAGMGVSDPEKYTKHFHLLAHADGSWATCVDYKVNTLTWKELMFDSSRTLVQILNDSYIQDLRNLEGHSKMVDELINLGVAKRTSRSGRSSLIPEDWQNLQGKQSISYRKNSNPQEWLEKFSGILNYVISSTNWRMEIPQFVSEMHRGFVLELSNRGEVKDGDFDQFMYDEDVFSHAITGSGTMRFTKRISIADEIQSHEEIPVPRYGRF
mgnify:FL=1